MTRVVKVGNKLIGGNNPITIQTMTNTRTSDVQALLDQVRVLEDAGADIIRITVNENSAVEGFRQAVLHSNVPIVADIHYDAELAIKAIEAGANKIRINPGNMSDDGVRRICEALKYNNIPVRVGVNSGSIAKSYYEKYKNSVTALVESALDNVALLEKHGIKDIVISVKSSNTVKTIDAYRELSKRTDYPLHLGVTEAGGGESAIIKSSIAIGSLLKDGIGDTIRVSLSDDPVREIEVAQKILGILGIDNHYIDIISCPTCGRTEFDVIGCSKRLNERFKGVKTSLKIAVMGCIVNGLGEGKEADYGIAGGKDRSVIFAHGEKIATVDNNKAEEYLINLVNKQING